MVIRPGASDPPTLRQVAELAGVSIKTASRALRQEGYVAPATAERVRTAARSIGYRVNAIASELRRGSVSTLVGLITGDLANPFYSRLARGVERELHPAGLQLVTGSSEEDPGAEAALVDALLQRRVRALLIVSAADDHSALSDDLARGVPLVFLDRPPVGLLADSVLIDNAAGAAAAVRHLIAAGHRRIGIVSDLSRLASQQDRLDGVAAAMAAAGIGDWQRWCRQDAHDIAAARLAVNDLLDADPAPTALLCLNNRITAGALTALQGRNGSATGAQATGLIGFDDFELSELLGVTVVGYDAEDMGRAAARLALERMDDPQRAVRKVVIPTRLIRRGSGERAPAP